MCARGVGDKLYAMFFCWLAPHEVSGSRCIIIPKYECDVMPPQHSTAAWWRTAEVRLCSIDFGDPLVALFPA